MNTSADAVKVSNEFTREGLRAYVTSYIDEESYSDESLYSVFEEFNYRVGLKAKQLGEMLDGFGIKFFWAVNLGKAVYSPKDSLEEYFYTDSQGNENHGIDAILAFLRDEVDVETVINDYWSRRSPHHSWVDEDDFHTSS